MIINVACMDRTINRKSGIELLKIIAILLIISSHTLQSLYQKPVYIKEIINPFINLLIPSFNIKLISLQIISYFGSIGNAIFFMCSAWFLCDKDESDKSKIIKFILDVFVISILYLFFFFLSSEQLTLRLIVRSLFPNTYSNYPYISCYILFLIIYPWINKFIKNINQKEHARINLVLCFIYFVISFFIPGAYFSNDIIIFIVFFILISYLKKYNYEFCNNIKKNILVVLSGILGLILLQVLSNCVCLFIPSLSEELLLRWKSGSNPFPFIMAFGLFNIFRNFTFRNHLINYISSCSMYIYLIHENLLFKSFTRIRIESILFNTYGLNNIFGIIFGFSLALYLVSLFVSLIYKSTLSRLTLAISQKLSLKIERVIEKNTNIIIEKIK